MNSFNHYSLGSVGAWLFDTVAGIGLDQEKPGWQHIIIYPRPGGGLTRAKADYESVRGRIVSDWKIERGQFALRTIVPANTTATVYVATKDASQVKEGDRPAASAEGVKFVRQADGCAVYEVGSGTYQFTAPAL